MAIRKCKAIFTTGIRKDRIFLHVTQPFVERMPVDVSRSFPTSTGISASRRVPGVLSLDRGDSKELLLVLCRLLQECSMCESVYGVWCMVRVLD